MKLAMTLRTRLFLSISALITVALLGLILGLVSVMQMAKTQESSIRSNFITLDLGLKLRQSLGDQLMMMLEQRPNPEALQASEQRYFELLDQGIAHEQRDGNSGGLSRARADYQRFLAAFDESQQASPPPGSKEKITETFNVLRNGLIAEHKQALENISASEHKSRERALLIAGLLGLVGLAVLIIGFVTAHGIARRFGGPIEALAKAADKIGQGDFEVTLPISSAAEMNQLTRRFGIMAEALRQHQATNIDELLAGQQRLQAVLDSIDDGLLMIDRQGRLEHLNPVAQRQLGWDEERLGQGLGEALGRPEMDDQLQLVLRGGSLEMVQLWVNLPARDKSAPAGYQSILASDIPNVALKGQAGSLRLIAGEFAGQHGPARTFTPMDVWDIRLNSGATTTLDLHAGRNTALVVLRGTVQVNGQERVQTGQLALFEREGEALSLQAEGDAIVLLLSGEPIDEPIVGHGPFVMNSEAEIHQAFVDFQSGRFGRMQE